MSICPLGAYVCKGRSGWLIPLGEALWENADLQLCIPMKFKRAPPLPPPPGPAMCSLLLDMLASNPDARPPADQLETRVRSALKEDSRWQKTRWRDLSSFGRHYENDCGPSCWQLDPNIPFGASGKRCNKMITWDFRCYFCHGNRSSGY